MFTRASSGRLENARRLLAETDFILIGAGAGLSASAGLNYQDSGLFRQRYPRFAGLGLKTIWEAIVAHWSPEDGEHRRFWAFWAHHIQTIRYDTSASPVYLGLLKLVAHIPHFVITTNVDAQFAKAGFQQEVTFTPQGDYAKFQCATPCNDLLHDNRDAVQRMLANLDVTNLLVRESDIPRCPACGGLPGTKSQERRALRGDAVYGATGGVPGVPESLDWRQTPAPGIGCRFQHARHHPLAVRADHAQASESLPHSCEPRGCAGASKH